MLLLAYQQGSNLLTLLAARLRKMFTTCNHFPRNGPKTSAVDNTSTSQTVARALFYRPRSLTVPYSRFTQSLRLTATLPAPSIKPFRGANRS